MRKLEDELKNLFVRFLELFFKPTQIPSINEGTIRDILVVRQHDQLGDMLCIVPMLRALKKLYPCANVTLIASPVNCEVMKHHPYITEVINYDKQKLLRSPIEVQGFWRQLRKRKYDLAIVPVTVSVSVTSDLIALLSGARIRVGAKSLQGKPNQTFFCFTHGEDLDWAKDPHRHQSLRNMDIIKMLNPQYDDLSCTIGLTEDEKHQAREVLKQYRELNNFLIGIHPGAGKKENRWLPNYYADVANRISNKHRAFIVITQGPKDEEQVEQMKSTLEIPYIIIKNQSIRFVAAIINELDYFISNDTGIMHVAGATKTRLLALFGPTDPLQWSSQKINDRYVAAENGNIESITVEQVISTVEDMIDKNN